MYRWCMNRMIAHTQCQRYFRGIMSCYGHKFCSPQVEVCRLPEGGSARPSPSSATYATPDLYRSVNTQSATLTIADWSMPITFHFIRQSSLRKIQRVRKVQNWVTVGLKREQSDTVPSISRLNGALKCCSWNGLRQLSFEVYQTDVSYLSDPRVLWKRRFHPQLSSLSDRYTQCCRVEGECGVGFVQPSAWIPPACVCP